MKLLLLTSILILCGTTYCQQTFSLDELLNACAAYDGPCPVAEIALGRAGGAHPPAGSAPPPSPESTAGPEQQKVQPGAKHSTTCNDAVVGASDTCPAASSNAGDSQGEENFFDRFIIKEVDDDTNTDIDGRLAHPAAWLVSFVSGLIVGILLGAHLKISCGKLPPPSPADKVASANAQHAPSPSPSSTELVVKEPSDELWNNAAGSATDGVDGVMSAAQLAQTRIILATVHAEHRALHAEIRSLHKAHEARLDQVTAETKKEAGEKKVQLLRAHHTAAMQWGFLLFVLASTVFGIINGRLVIMLDKCSVPRATQGQLVAMLASANVVRALDNFFLQGWGAYVACLITDTGLFAVGAFVAFHIMLWALRAAVAGVKLGSAWELELVFMNGLVLAGGAVTIISMLGGMPCVTLLLWWTWCAVCWAIQSNITSNSNSSLLSASMLWIGLAPIAIACISFANWSATNDAEVHMRLMLRHAGSCMIVFLNPRLA